MIWANLEIICKKKKEFLTLRASTFLVACSLGLNAYNYKTFTWGLLDTLNSKVLASNQLFWAILKILPTITW